MAGSPVLRPRRVHELKVAMGRAGVTRIAFCDIQRHRVMSSGVMTIIICCSIWYSLGDFTIVRRPH